MPGSLHDRSIEIILSSQSPRGAYVASPTFGTYRYCWLRDGAFTAYAMDLVGEHTSAHRFNDWVARTVHGRRDAVALAIKKAAWGEPLTARDYLHTRYTLDGDEATSDDWPNDQLDGYGTWLWALRKHCQLSAIPLPSVWRVAADTIASYLSALWSYPCYDCWEEYPQRVHWYTLAAIAGGLQAHAELTGTDHAGTIQAIQGVLFEQSLVADRFVKYLGSVDVDASLVGLAVPYGIVQPGDPRVRRAVDELERSLRFGGGVHRYAKDTYYGGGEWVLLTAWLGWYYREAGEISKAADALAWVEAQSDKLGQLPEQIPATLLDPAPYAPWRQRWGEIARPLVWSHAKHLILSSDLRADWLSTRS